MGGMDKNSSQIKLTVLAYLLKIWNKMIYRSTIYSSAGWWYWNIKCMYIVIENSNRFHSKIDAEQAVKEFCLTHNFNIHNEY